MTHETLKWKLFPFSLSGEAKQWYIRVVGGVNGSWIELKERHQVMEGHVPHPRGSSIDMLSGGSPYSRADRGNNGHFHL